MLSQASFGVHIHTIVIEEEVTHLSVMMDPLTMIYFR